MGISSMYGDSVKEESKSVYILEDFPVEKMHELGFIKKSRKEV